MSEHDLETELEYTRRRRPTLAAAMLSGAAFLAVCFVVGYQLAVRFI